MSLAQGINSLQIGDFVSINLLEPHGTNYYIVQQVTADSIMLRGQSDVAVPLTVVQAFIQARRVHVYKNIEDLPEEFRARVESAEFNAKLNRAFADIANNLSHDTD